MPCSSGVDVCQSFVGQIGSVAFCVGASLLQTEVGHIDTASAVARTANWLLRELFGRIFRALLGISPTPFLRSQDFRTALTADQHLVPGGIAYPLVDNPSGKIALGLLRCPETGQLSDLHGLNGCTNEAPTPADPYVFGYPFSKLNRLPLCNFRGTSNDDFDFTTRQRISRYH
jgi:hypothetical protein